ncbi:hypothetical protein GQ53DRAFT_515050 [Thozetella sp. PMI_491]|nr:hypothetical protein GQ53DRAFT_515050 [Thozetella sp. PMI_491]
MRDGHQVQPRCGCSSHTVRGVRPGLPGRRNRGCESSARALSRLRPGYVVKSPPPPLFVPSSSPPHSRAPSLSNRTLQYLGGATESRNSDLFPCTRIKNPEKKRPSTTIGERQTIPRFHRFEPGPDICREWEFGELIGQGSDDARGSPAVSTPQPRASLPTPQPDQRTILASLARLPNTPPPIPERPSIQAAGKARVLLWPPRRRTRRHKQSPCWLYPTILTSTSPPPSYPFTCTYLPTFGPRQRRCCLQPAGLCPLLPPFFFL